HLCKGRFRIVLTHQHTASVIYKMCGHSRKDASGRPGNIRQYYPDGSERKQIAELYVIHPKEKSRYDDGRPDTPALLEGPKYIAAVQHLFADSRHQCYMKKCEPYIMIAFKEVLNHLHL